MYQVPKMCLIDFAHPAPEYAPAPGKSRSIRPESEEKSMAKEVARNEWGIILQQTPELLELKWLASTATMTDGGFMATLCLFASEAEKARARSLLIDATEFRHRFGPDVMRWRDDHIIPRYGGAGVRKFAFQMPAEFPNAGKEEREGSAVFPTKWFVDRQAALDWLRDLP